MALQLTLELDSGISVTNAYHKIVQMSVAARGTTASAYLEVASYFNSTKADENASPVLTRTFLMPTFDKADTNTTALEQAYIYI